MTTIVIVVSQINHFQCSLIYFSSRESAALFQWHVRSRYIKIK